jgi:hypothetical protein
VLTEWTCFYMCSCSVVTYILQCQWYFFQRLWLPVNISALCMKSLFMVKQKAVQTCPCLYFYPFHNIHTSLSLSFHQDVCLGHLQLCPLAQYNTTVWKKNASLRLHVILSVCVQHLWLDCNAIFILSAQFNIWLHIASMHTDWQSVWQIRLCTVEIASEFEHLFTTQLSISY